MAIQGEEGSSDAAPSWFETSVNGLHDRVFSALHHAFTGGEVGPFELRYDDAGIRVEVEALRDGTFGIAAIGLDPDAFERPEFTCRCGHESPSNSPGVRLELPHLTVAVRVYCWPQLTSGLGAILMAVRAAVPAAQLELKARRRTSASRSVCNSVPKLRDGAITPAMAKRAIFLRRLQYHQLAEHSLLWTGWDDPVCRATTRRVLAAIDENRRTEASLARITDELSCTAHTDSTSVESLFDSPWIASGDRRILTPTGQSHLRQLTAASKPFTSVAQARHPLRPWQAEALSSWSAHGRIGVIEAVTGTGKTRLGVEATAEALADGLRVVICVPTLDLIDQWVDALGDCGMGNVGRVGGSREDNFVKHPVLVGTVQTLRRRPHLLDRTDKALIIADECHRYAAPAFIKALDDRYVRRLGLTATFERMDDRIRDLEKFFVGQPCFRIGYDRAVREQVVSHFIVATLGVDFTAEERAGYDEADAQCKESRRRLVARGVPETPFGEFMAAVAWLAKEGDAEARTYLKAFAERAEVLGDAQAKAGVIRQLAPLMVDGGTLIFTSRIQTAEDLASLLRGEHLAMAAIHSETDRAERRAVLTKFRHHQLHGVVAPRILDEGIDVPEADLALVLSATSNRRQMIQRMGRVLRLKKDGRLARFVLLYVRGTSEDPVGGDAHESFFDMITSAADQVRAFTTRELPELSIFLRQGRVAIQPLLISSDQIEPRASVKRLPARQRPRSSPPRRAAAPRSAALCPICFIATPATGVCDDCS